MNEELKQFGAACDALRDAGYSVVAVAVKYTPNDAYFSTRLSLTEVPEVGVTKNHIVLDALREIANQWSAENHSKEQSSEPRR
jgi:hypothetical protein